MTKALVAMHSAARRQPGYAKGLAANLGSRGHDIELFEANWADLGDPSTFGDAEQFAAIRSEFFRELGVPRTAMPFIEPPGVDPRSTPGAAFDPILLYGFIADIRKKVQQRLLQQLVAARRAGHLSVSVIAHSMGTVVAFDLLAMTPAGDNRLPAIELFITLGSPLWMPFFDERHPRKLHAVDSWLNLYHPGDFIGRALLPAFGDDGPCPPLDMPVRDDDDPQAPHSHYWTSALTAQMLDYAWRGLESKH